MPDYRRYYTPGATVFLTIVTEQRRPLFADPTNVEHLRSALRIVLQEWPFDIAAAVVLHDHMHFLWTLPAGDSAYSKRVGRMKAKFTSALEATVASVSKSRVKHRESEVWQRRFWEHTIRDDDDFKGHLDYVHYNPVKHGLARCPHEWPYSSFNKWVRLGEYDGNWCCRCGDRTFKVPDFSKIQDIAGE